jgi:competence protein ComEC
LLISHADGDHAGGAPGLMDVVPVREVRGGEPVRGIELEPCERGMRWAWDGVDFELLHLLEGVKRRATTTAPAYCASLPRAALPARG